MIDATDAPEEGALEGRPVPAVPAVPAADDPAGPASDGHLAAETMNGYAARTLESEALLAADDHLAGCADCRGRLVDDAGLRMTVGSLAREVAAARRSEPDHLPYESVEAMAEDRLRGPAREVADLHLGACATCAGEVADLRAFAAAHRAARRAAATAVAASLAGEQARRLPVAVTDAGTAPTARHTRAAMAAARGLATAVPAADAEVAPALTLPSADRPGATRGAIIGAVVVTLLVAAGGAWLATRGLRQKVVTLAATVDQLQQEKAALQATADTASASRTEIERQAVESARAAAAKVAVTLNDRQGKDQAIAVGIDDDGQLVGLDGLRIADARALAVALRKGAIEVPAPVLELGRAGPGADVPGPVPRFPAGQMIRGVRPTFTWDAVEAATGYTIAVSDEGGTVIVRGGPTRATKWTSPRSLQRGALYTWTVTATLAAEPATAPDADSPIPGANGAAAGAALPPRTGSLVSPRARFRVLDQESATGLDRALRAAEGSHLAAGVFMARAGVLDEALGELRLLAEANPQSPLAQSLLASVETAGTAR
jgi:hypothetical protein